MTETPPLQPRPKLDRWLRDRGMGAVDLARRWHITPQAASRYLLPFEHRKRSKPNEERMADVLAWTGGEVTAADWFSPQLSGVPLPASIGHLAREDAQ